MIHYNVWFSLKPAIEESQGLQLVRDFLSQLSEAGEASAFTLLRNSGSPPRSKLPRYQAHVVFRSPEALSEAMTLQAQRGIHQGAHGRVIDAVSEFHVEVFSEISPATPADRDHVYACAI